MARPIQASLLAWLAVNRVAVAQDAVTPAPEPAAPPERITGFVQEEMTAVLDVHKRFSNRMQEFTEDVKAAALQRRQEEMNKVTEGYRAKRAEKAEQERVLRTLSIKRFEAFLAKHPNAGHTPHVMFRLAELYFEEAVEEWDLAADEYDELEKLADGDDSFDLPPSPVRDYGKAMALYQGILDDHPNYEFRDGAYYMLGYCYYDDLSDSLDPERAREEFTDLVKYHPASDAAVDASMRLGEYYFDENDREKAIGYYQIVVDAGRENRLYDRGLYKLGWAYYKESDYDRTLSLFTDLLDRSEEIRLESGEDSALAPEAIEYMAISFSDLADMEGGEPLDKVGIWFQKVGERSFERTIYDRLADVLIQQGRFDQGIATYRFLQERWPLEPDNPKYQQRISEIYASQPFPDQAAAAQALLALSETYGEGSAWWEANRNNPEAIAVARGFIEKSLVAIALELHIRAQESGTREDFAAAANQYREYLDAFPFADDYAEYQWYLADTLYQASRYDEAIKEYLRLIATDGHPYGDGSRWQMVKAWTQILVNTFGKVEQLPEGAVVESTVEAATGDRPVYLLGEQHIAFISAADDIRNDDFEQVDYKKALEENRAALHYQPAQILYEHGRYEEARPRLIEVVDEFPTYDEAAYAASLLVNTYIEEGNLEMVREWTGKFAAMALGSTAELTEEKARFFATQQEGAAFKLAGQLMEKGDLLDAATAFLDFLEEFPQSEYIDEALYNAGAMYDNAGKVEPANEIYEQYINLYPRDDKSEQLYARIAGNYSDVLELDQAIDYYRRLIRNFPESERAADAMANSALLKVGVGDHVGAARALEDFARKFPDDPDVETYFWIAGEQWALVSEDKALAFYRRYLDRFVDSNPDHTIEALHWLADYWEKKGNERRAERGWEDLMNRYESMLNAQLDMGPRALNLVAKTAFRDVQASYDVYALVEFPTDPAELAEYLTVTKLEGLQALVKGTLAFIQRYPDFEYSTAALYIQGMTYLTYAEMLYDVPDPELDFPAGTPEEMIEEILEEFRSGLRDRAQPVEEKAIARLQAVLAKSAESKRSSIWIDRSIEALNAIRPREYPLEKAEVRGEAESIVIPTGRPRSRPGSAFEKEKVKKQAPPKPAPTPEEAPAAPGPEAPVPGPEGSGGETPALETPALETPAPEVPAPAPEAPQPEVPEDCPWGGGGQ
jgi:TolA-binding protein